MKCFGFITKHVHLILKRNKNGSLVVGLGPFGNPFSFFGNPIRKKSKPPNAPPQNQQSSTIHYLTKPPLSPPQQQKKRKKKHANTQAPCSWKDRKQYPSCNNTNAVSLGSILRSFLHHSYVLPPPPWQYLKEGKIHLCFRGWFRWSVPK